MKFECVYCGKTHIRTGELVDEHIRCSCGHRFYAFYHEGMKMTIPSKDVESLEAVLTFRQFLARTGRCRDAAGAKGGPVDYTMILRRADPLGLMEIGLERYQDETFGKRIVNCGDIASLCESLNSDGHVDILIRNKGNYIDLIEMRGKKKARGDPPAFPGWEGSGQLKDWQTEIMEQDAARNGLLFGDAG